MQNFSFKCLVYNAKIIEKNSQQAKEKKECFDYVNPCGESMHEFECDDIEDISNYIAKCSACVSVTSKGKRKYSCGIESYFKHRIANPT